MEINRTIIIAEAGVNHNGDLRLARKLIDVSKEAGADYVKFQTFIAEESISKSAQKATYQIKNTYGEEESHLEMVRKLELTEAQHIELRDYCFKKGIKFLSTAFDHKSIELLMKLGIDQFKIPSGEITNLPYLEKVAELGLPIIMSTGMATMEEIEVSMKVLLKNGAKKDDITILHCNTEYPTPMKDVNLNAMRSIQQKFGVKVGYSDHTLGIEIPIAAVAIGAAVIEKHFTLNRDMIGPDHSASLEPDELKHMVESVRNIERALGDGVKRPSASESRNIPIVRKSIHARNEIKTGELFSSSNLVAKRPGSGISPMKWHELIGRQASKNYSADDLIEEEL